MLDGREARRRALRISVLAPLERGLRLSRADEGLSPRSVVDDSEPQVPPACALAASGVPLYGGVHARAPGAELQRLEGLTDAVLKRVAAGNVLLRLALGEQGFAVTTNSDRADGKQARMLSPRARRYTTEAEARCVAGVPDWVVLEGGARERWRQIGNVLPLGSAVAIATAVARAAWRWVA